MCVPLSFVFSLHSFIRFTVYNGIVFTVICVSSFYTALIYDLISKPHNGSNIFPYYIFSANLHTIEGANFLKRPQTGAVTLYVLRHIKTFLLLVTHDIFLFAMHSVDQLQYSLYSNTYYIYADCKFCHSILSHET